MASKKKTSKTSPKKKSTSTQSSLPVHIEEATLEQYSETLTEAVGIVEAGRQIVVRSANSAMTATYWLMGRLIVKEEQKGEKRAKYGEELIERLAKDMSQRFGHGFSRSGLHRMRKFYLLWPVPGSLSSNDIKESSPLPIVATVLRQSFTEEIVAVAKFPLPWSHYTRLMSVPSDKAREFYEEEALRGGWSIRQLERQIGTQFYERTMLSRDKAYMLKEGAASKPEDAVSFDEMIKDPLFFEFVGLKDRYSEGDLEHALVSNLRAFLLEMGKEFAFVDQKRRLRIDDEWHQIDLLLFHRRLRALVIIDLKMHKLTHADIGQMHLYTSYAREHWRVEGENPPVGLILCTEKKAALARYAMDNLPNQILAAEYRTILPSEEELTQELQRLRRQLELRAMTEGKTLSASNEEKASD